MNRIKIMENILNQLDNKKIASCVQNTCFELGGDAFDYLLNHIQKEMLSSRQIVNILYVLYSLSREKCHGRQSDVFNVAERLMMDNDIEIRSEAAVISVYLAKIFENYPDLNIEYDREKFVTKVEEMLNIGVSDRATSALKKYLSDYFAEYPPMPLKTDINLFPEKDCAHT